MAHDNRLHLSQTPNTLKQYARAAMAKGKKPRPDMELPRIDILLNGVASKASDVQAYCDVCGFSFDGQTLPLPYPHMLAFPLHIELMLHKAFPLALLGLVHIRNSITQHKAISVDDTLDIHCYLSDSEVTDKGLEFDIKTEISVQGSLVWESTSTNLARMKSDKKGAPSERPELPKHALSEQWILPENLGRSYAKVSGDSNPIHLYKQTARMFGFKGHIAHGMWTKARAIAALTRKVKSDQLTVEVSFKLPIFLPSTVEMQFSPSNDGAEFDVRDIKGEKMHMQGTLTVNNG